MQPAISVKYPRIWYAGACIFAGLVVAMPYLIVLLGLFAMSKVRSWVPNPCV